MPRPHAVQMGGVGGVLQRLTWSMLSLLLHFRSKEVWDFFFKHNQILSHHARSAPGTAEHRCADVTSRQSLPGTLRP